MFLAKMTCSDLRGDVFHVTPHDTTNRDLLSLVRLSSITGGRIVWRGRSDVLVMRRKQSLQEQLLI